MYIFILLTAMINIDLVLLFNWYMDSSVHSFTLCFL